MKFFRKKDYTVLFFAFIILAVLNLLFIWHFNSELLNLVLNPVVLKVPNSNFMQEYYQVQSNWLNIWLTILAIALAVLGIVAALDYKAKKDEMEKIIAKAKDKINSNEVQMKKDLEEVKEYVNKAKASEYTAKAYNALQNKEYEECIEYSTKALKIEETKGNYINRGNAYAELEKIDSAISDYDKAIDLDNKSILPHLNKGLVSLRSDKFEGALAEFKQIEKMDANYPKIHFHIGHAYMNLKKYDNAINELSLNLKYNLRDIPSYLDRATVYCLKKDYSSAITDFLEILKIDSTYYSDVFYYNFLESCIFLPDFEKAYSIIKIYINKSNEPYIYEDDYSTWLNSLNEHNKEPYVLEIIGLINKALTKKNRE